MSTQNLLSPQYLETIPCNLCGSNKNSLWGKSEGFSIVKCDGCGLIYVNPRLNREGLQIAYGHDYYQMHVESGALEKREKMYEIELREIQSLRTGGKILDVGCGGGFFVSRFGKSWEKSGTEFNPVAAEEARKNFGLDVRVGPLPELGYSSEAFDVVNLRGVIEHFQDPYSYLVESYRILKKGGLVAINTPNIGSLCAQIYKEKFRLVTPKYHIYYFSTQTMTEMLKKAGFKIVRIRYFYLGTPYAHWTDGFKLLADSVRLAFNPVAPVVSPAFFDNVVHVYAEK